MMKESFWNGRELLHIGPKGTRYWKAERRGSEVITTARNPNAKPKETRKTYPDKAKASSEMLKAIRKKMLDDFVYLRPRADAKVGELVFAVALPIGGYSDNFDVTPDGKTLFIGAGRGDPKALVLRVEPETGKVERFSVDKDPVSSQLFIHGANLSADGTLGYFGLNSNVRSIDLATGKWASVASVMHKGKQHVNPFCVEPQRDASHQRLLVANSGALEVRELVSGKVLCKIPVGTKTAECRKIALSPSGKLLVAYVVSRAVVYNHADAKNDKTNDLQVWSVDGGKLVATIEVGEIRDDPMQLGVTFDDKHVLHFSTKEFSLFEIKTQEHTTLKLPYRQHETPLWDWTSSGEMIVCYGSELFRMEASNPSLLFQIEIGAHRIRCCQGLIIIGGGGLFYAYKAEV